MTPDLINLLEGELLRVDPQTSGARAKAELMAGPIADWIMLRFVEWAEKGLADLPSREYWSQYVD